MNRRLAAALCSFLLSAAAFGATLRLIELRGHARILSIDEPILKARVFVFHRYPDGVFVSVPAADVLGIATTTIGPEKAQSTEKAKFLRGETVVLGPTGEGQSENTTGEGAPVPEATYSDYGEAFSAGCCSGPSLAPPRRPLAPALVGPNGFPGTPTRPIGPNGFPGTPTREIGPNGFPILAPSPAPR